MATWDDFILFVLGMAIGNVLMRLLQCSGRKTARFPTDEATYYGDDPMYVETRTGDLYLRSELIHKYGRPKFHELEADRVFVPERRYREMDKHGQR